MVFVGGAAFSTLISQTAHAANPVTVDDCSKRLLTFPTWFNGLVKVENDKCVIKTPKEACSALDAADCVTLTSFIWRIVLNIIEIGLQIVGYLAGIMILYGGFKFITSSGDSAAVEGARKTITNASIGLIISITSVAIVNLILGLLSGTTTVAQIRSVDGSVETVNVPITTAADILKNGLNIFYYLVGAIAVIMIIKAGFTYITSGGDSANVTKAKNTILYAVIGLIVVITAFAITNFIIGSFAR